MHDAPSHAARSRLEVRYAETDQMGVVHHANYLVWFEVARTELCRQAGFHYAEIERQGLLLLVTGADLSYRAAARYGDTIDIACWVDRVASRGVTFAYRVNRAGSLLVAGVTEHVWVDAENRRPTRFPPSLVEPFRRFLPAPDGE